MATDKGLIDTGSLEEFLKRVRSYDVDLIYTKGGVESVHHYTDLAALNGIVGSQDLWLTHARFSNDDEEMTHGLGIAKTVIGEHIDRTSVGTERSYLRRLLAALVAQDAEAVYICCFCKSGDLLSQWRGYGANGTGVSLGFDPSGFRFITGPDSPRYGLVRLWSVFYEEATQRHIIDEAIAFGRQAGKTLAERVHVAAEAIRFFIPTFKNERFTEEGEIRLIFTPNAKAVPAPPAPDFRVARGMLVPYYRLQALHGGATPHALPLRTVHIGPSARKVLNAQAVEMLLAKAGAKNVPVRVSETPYRG